MRFFFYLSIILAALIPAMLQAGDEKEKLSRTDFAYGMELTFNGSGAIYGLTLSDKIYQGCTRADLGDLRVFNKSSIVPHLVRPQRSEQQQQVPISLPFFPLMGHHSGASTPDLRIATNARGVIIDFHQKESTAASPVTAYIVDLSSLEEKKKIDWLEFAWIGQSEQFSTRVRIDTSDDLNSWFPLVHSASLAQLSFNNHQLLRNRILLSKVLNKNSRKYLRLSWPSGKKGVTLSSLLGGYGSTKQEHPRIVHTPVGVAVANSKSDTLSYHYTSDGFYPVDQLSVRFPQPNSLARVTLSSRAEEDIPWQRRATQLAYQLTVDGVILDSKVRHISPTNHRFWRLEMESGVLDEVIPTLELGWLPGQLVFLAQGEAPFTLAYGRAGLKGQRFQVNEMLAAIDPDEKKGLLQSALAGEEIELGGSIQRKPITELPWKVWLLWAGLVLGVLVIGSMIRQLYKEMR